MKLELEVINPLMQLSFTTGHGIDPEGFMPPSCKLLYFNTTRFQMKFKRKKLPFSILTQNYTSVIFYEVP